MSQIIDDAKEFAAAADSYKAMQNEAPLASVEHDDDAPNTPVKRGAACQYAEYGPGYMPTCRTIKTLPAGCYDIEIDQKGVYAVPAPPPSGLLLELPEMRSEEVIKTVERFWASEKDYKEGNKFVKGGAQFKAGIMVYGPPGSGKSCTIKLVSRKLVERGGTVFFSSANPAFVSRFLTDFARVENNRKCLVILEDIDSLIHNYGESGYLEMLDSAKTIDNVLFIATTNYPERLDPRIYNRPGRFSHTIKIGLPPPATRRAYLKAILKDHSDVETLVNLTGGFSIDHLSALINAVYREGKNIQEEAERLRTMFRMPKAGDEKAIGIT